MKRTARVEDFEAPQLRYLQFLKDPEAIEIFHRLRESGDTFDLAKEWIEEDGGNRIVGIATILSTEIKGFNFVCWHASGPGKCYGNGLTADAAVIELDFRLKLRPLRVLE